MSELTVQQLAAHLQTISEPHSAEIFFAYRDAILAHDDALRSRVDKANELWTRIVDALAPSEVENIDVAVLLIKKLKTQAVKETRQ